MMLTFDTWSKKIMQMEKGELKYYIKHKHLWLFTYVLLIYRQQTKWS